MLVSLFSADFLIFFYMYIFFCLRTDVAKIKSKHFRIEYEAKVDGGGGGGGSRGSSGLLAFNHIIR
jgi:hypothetical protein